MANCQCQTYPRPAPDFTANALDDSEADGSAVAR
jgi:hypothetical protein